MKIWNKTIISTAEQNVAIYPTETFDGIIIETKELDGLTGSPRLYLDRDEMELLIIKMQEMMKYVTENQDKLLGTILQCKSCGLSSDSSGNYSMLHPAFVMLRDDKDTCDSLESIKEIENMVKTLITV